MLPIKQILIDLSSTIIATSIGIMVLKKIRPFYKLLLLQVILYLIVDSIAANMKNNAWIYNLYMPIEVMLLLIAAKHHLIIHKSKLILKIIFGIYFMIFMMDILLFTGLEKFAYHGAIIEGIIITGVFLTILYFHLIKRGSTKIDGALVLSSIGIILYFGATIPDLALIFYLQKINPSLNQMLFRNIVVTLASIRYLFIAISFYIEAQRNSRIE